MTISTNEVGNLTAFRGRETGNVVTQVRLVSRFLDVAFKLLSRRSKRLELYAKFGANGQDNIGDPLGHLFVRQSRRHERHAPFQAFEQRAAFLSGGDEFRKSPRTQIICDDQVGQGGAIESCDHGRVSRQTRNANKSHLNKPGLPGQLFSGNTLTEFYPTQIDFVRGNATGPNRLRSGKRDRAKSASFGEMQHGQIGFARGNSTFNLRQKNLETCVSDWVHIARTSER